MFAEFTFEKNAALDAPASLGVNFEGSILRVGNDGLVTNWTKMFDVRTNALSFPPTTPLPEAANGSLYMANQSILRVSTRPASVSSTRSPTPRGTR